MLSHEKRTENQILRWLVINFTLILLMIIVGGLTRLTNSGLSITEWELFTGILPPLSNSKWLDYFNLYKNIPQFQLINPDMNLSEFKVIFYWEYFHRVLGRVIGLVFIIPLLFFHFKNKINSSNLVSFYTVAALIIVQGIVGWYMVQSGLVNDVTVSHYRLSLHLSIAVLIVSILFWQIINISNHKDKLFYNMTKNNFPYLLLIILIFLQVVLGAFVSGLDAGKIYQTWPMMGANYIPDDFYLENIKSLFDLENHSLVQFYHRNMAYLISIYILALIVFTFKKNDETLYKPSIILLFVLLLQISLGIFTLLSNLNIILAVLHQVLSVILVLSALNLYYSIMK